MEHLVHVGVGAELEKKVAWLKAHGYTGEISSDNKYGAIVIKYDYFYGGNVTCFAIMSSMGSKAISWEARLQKRYDVHWDKNETYKKI